MVSILEDIKDKAKQLINISAPHVVRQTSGYDASKSMVVVAGMPLDGIISSVISADSITRQETGIDYYYTTYYEVITQRTLTVTVLPTAKCLDTLRMLALKQLETKGWFNISVHENGNIINVYRGWIIDLPEIGMSQDAADRTITFGIKTMHSGVSVIDQPTEYEDSIYNKYGNRPDVAKPHSETVLSEVSGKPYPEPYIENETPYKENVNGSNDDQSEAPYEITPIKDAE